VLTAHVVSSVGWLGAVLAFVGLALIAMTSQDGRTVRAAVLVMEPVGWYVLLPLVLTSLLTGIIQRLASTWGLVRHYWVLLKLIIGTVSTYVFVAFLLTTVGSATTGAADQATSVERLRALAGTPRDHALLALAGLVTATVLAVYKPRALTRYGRRRLDQERVRSRAEVGTPHAGDEHGGTRSGPRGRFHRQPWFRARRG
jgi:hypothetical protein